MKDQIRKDERIDIRVSPEEKKIFRRAHKLSGDKTFSGFVTRIIRAKSVQIIEENERILTSKRDKEIFFQAIFADQEPNQALVDAANKFKSTLEKAN
jgi:uncharacterized protein (DUF1778 family)